MLRNILKETAQFYILDFDIEGLEDFNINQFGEAIKNYFDKTLKFPKIGIKLANNQRTIYLKFPILQDLGYLIDKSETNLLHIRIDLASALRTEYAAEISLKNSADFSFLIRRYSLSDLFAGKIGAILTRETIEGRIKIARFKGRDYYDLIWFLEKGVKPNWMMVKKTTGFDQKKAKQRLKEKINQVTPGMLKKDLLPFFENPAFVENFANNFQKLAEGLVKNLSKSTIFNLLEKNFLTECIIYSTFRP